MDDKTSEAVNAQVLEVLNKVVRLIKTQMMRDCYTSEYVSKLQTGARSYEPLNGIIMLKLEDNRTMEMYLAELDVLLKKPRHDGPVVQMITDTD